MSIVSQLTAEQKNTLSGILNNTAISTDLRTLSYYQALSSYGFSYGDLAASIVTNSAFGGQVANEFLREYGLAHGVLLGETAMAGIRFDLAIADFNARVANNGMELLAQTYRVYHEAVFVRYGLAIDAWTANIPVQILGQDAWNQIVDQGAVGYANVVAEMADLALRHGSFSEAVIATQAQAWLTNAAVAGANIIGVTGSANVGRLVVSRDSANELKFSFGQDVIDGEFSGELSFNLSTRALAKSISYTRDKTTTTTYDQATSRPATVEDFYKSGGTATTLYHNDPASNSWAETAVYDPQHRHVMDITENRDGTKTIVQLDPVTGKVLLTTQVSADEKISSLVGARDLDFNSFVKVAATTLASQLLSKVIFDNNLPAALTTSALAQAAIDSALAPAGQSVDFIREFSTSLFSMASIYAYQHASTELSDALGIPREIGGVVGGAAVDLITKSLVQDVMAKLGVSGPSTDVLTVANFEQAIGSAGAAYFSSQLVQMLVGDSVESQIGQAVGSALASWALGPVGVLETMFVVFGSSLFSGIVGSLFAGQPSVGPNASAVGRWNAATGHFEFKVDYVDNGGNAKAVSAGLDILDKVMDQLVPTMGGHTTGPVPDMSIFWIQGKYYYALGDHYAQIGGGKAFDTLGQAVEAAAVKWLASIHFKDADPYMVYAAQHTNAKTIGDLITDLNAARSFSAYHADPAAFNAALIISNSPSQLAQWQSDYARAQALGLDKLTAADIADLIGPGAASPWKQAVNGSWEYAFDLANPNGTIFKLPAMVLGGGSDMLHAGGYSFVAASDANANWKIIEANAEGTIVASADIKLNGVALKNYLPVGSALLGITTGALGTHGSDLVVKSGNNVTFYELDPAQTGVVGKYVTVTGLGKSITGPNILGTDRDFLGKHGFDIFAVGANGGVNVWEIDSKGTILASAWLMTPNAKAFTLAAGSSIIGSGSSLSGTHDQALFIRFPDGHVETREFDVSEVGLIRLGQVLKNPDGTPLVVEAGSTIEVLNNGTATRDFLIHHADQHVQHVDVDSTGRATAITDLLNANGTAYTQPHGQEVIGEGDQFYGRTGHVLFSMADTGRVSATIFDDHWQAVTSTPLYNKDGSGMYFGPGTILLGSADNLLGTHGPSEIVELPSGQIAIYEFPVNDSKAAAFAAVTNANGTPFILGADESIAGATHRFGGGQPVELVVQKANGALVVNEMSSSGTITSTLALKNADGSAFIVEKGVTISATGLNLEGFNGADLVLHHPNGSSNVVEFNATNGKVLAMGPSVSTGSGPSHLYLAGNTTDHELAFEMRGNDTVVKFLDTADTFTFKNAAADMTVHSANGELAHKADILALANALATFETAHPEYSPEVVNATPNDPGYMAVHNAYWHYDI